MNLKRPWKKSDSIILWQTVVDYCKPNLMVAPLAAAEFSSSLDKSQTHHWACVYPSSTHMLFGPQEKNLF